MKNLLLEHYELIKQRGFISPETSLGAFIDKLTEEYYEVLNAYVDDCVVDQTPSKEFIHECTDLVMVVLNMFQHYNIDFREELKRNVELNRSKCPKV